MNGRTARTLRKQAGYNANESRGNESYDEKKFNRMEMVNGLMTPVVKITRSLKHSTARSKYRDLKELHRLAGV